MTDLKEVTVKALIQILLEYPMDWKIEIRNKYGVKLNSTRIVAVECEGLCSLFG